MFVMVAQTIGYYPSEHLFYWTIIIILFLLIWPFYDLLEFLYPTWYHNYCMSLNPSNFPQISLGVGYHKISVSTVGYLFHNR